MSGTRRVVVLAVLTFAVLVGGTVPASAEFARSRNLPKHGVATYTVAPPTDVKVLRSQCWLTTTTREVTRTATSTSIRIVSRTERTGTVVFDEVTTVSGDTTTTTTRSTRFDVSLSWTGSTSKGVVGYAIVGHVPGSSGVIDQTAATSWNESFDARYLGYAPTLSVRTLTSYGWTADSAQTGALTC